MNEQAIEDREKTAKLFKMLQKSGAEAAFVVMLINGDVTCNWYGDPLVIGSMAALGKKAAWDYMSGDTESQDITADVEKEDQDWDIKKLKLS